MSDPRIAHVSALPAATAAGVGGVGTYTAALLQLLAPAPYEMTLVCNADAATRALLPPNVHIERCWHFGDPFYPRAIARALGRIEPRIVHLQQELFLFGPGPRALLFPLLLRMLRGRYRVVVTVHGVTTDEEIDESLMRGRRSPVPLSMLRTLIVGIFRAIARSGADLVVHSGVLAKRLTDLGADPERVTVIAHPLFARPPAATLSRNEARERLGIPADARVATTWGYWNGYKGIDRLVDGFALYRRAHPEAMLVLGMGPHPQLHDDTSYMAAYTNELDRFAAVPGVRAVGFIADQELPAYVRAADVCVFAYTKYLAASGPATYAVTLGTPVLLSSVFADAPAAITFDPQPEPIAAALERFFADPAQHAIASSTLRTQAEDDVVRAAYCALYDRLLAQ